MNKLDKESVIGISALLVHAANIDEIYSAHEKDLIKKCNYYLKNNEILEKVSYAGYIKTNKFHNYKNRVEELEVFIRENYFNEENL